MFKKVMLSLFLIAGFAISSFAQENLRTGTWKYTVESSRGQEVVVFHITEGLDGLKATCKDESFDLSSEGDILSWNFSRLTANGKIDYRAEGVKESPAKYVGTSEPVSGTGIRFTWMLENFRDE